MHLMIDKQGRIRTTYSFTRAFSLYRRKANRSSRVFTHQLGVLIRMARLPVVNRFGYSARRIPLTEVNEIERVFFFCVFCKSINCQNWMTTFLFLDLHPCAWVGVLASEVPTEAELFVNCKLLTKVTSTTLVVVENFSSCFITIGFQ